MNQAEFTFIKEEIDKVTFIKGDRFDIIAIPFRFPLTDKQSQINSNNLIEKIVNIGKGRYELILPPEPDYPYILNLKTGKKLPHRPRNQYDAWHVAGVTITCHKLVGYLAIKNENPALFDVVDHINEDKGDFRLNNLRWTSNGGNVREAQSNKKIRQSLPQSKIKSLQKKLKQDLSLDEFFKVCHDVIKLKNKS